MEPDVFVCGEEPGQFWTDDTDDISEHGDEYHSTVKGEDETSTTRDPDGEFQGVQSSQLLVGFLYTVR